MLNGEDKENALRRLRKISGQAAGIERMVESDRYCIDVLLQVAAARSALNKVAEILMARHIETCVRSAFSAGDAADEKEKIDELLKVFARLT